MNKTPYLLMAAVELLISWWLWVLSPTDSVRVWYPTVWAYCGEHAILWTAAFLLLVLSSAGLIAKRSQENIHAVVCGVCAEISVSLYLWFVAGMEGDTPRVWYSGRLRDYLILRLATWSVLTLIVIGGYAVEGWFSRRQRSSATE